MVHRISIYLRRSKARLRLPGLAGRFAVAAILLWCWTGPGYGQAIDFTAQRALVNKSVLGVMGDGARGTDFAMIADLASVLDRGYERRILPMAGTGSVRAIEDLLLLRGVDIAFVQADVLDFYKKADLFPNIDERIRYLAKLYGKEFHLLASKDIKSIDDLEGKRVNFGPASSGSFLTASLVFKTLGLTVDVGDDDYQVALGKLMQGEIDAWIRVDAKPAVQLEGLASEDGVHLLSLPDRDLGEAYASAELTAKDYPSLIDEEAAVQTLSVPTVMAVYAWSTRPEKNAQLQDFYKAFNQGIDTLQQPPFHQKWHEVDLSSEIPGWQRF